VEFTNTLSPRKKSPRSQGGAPDEPDKEPSENTSEKIFERLAKGEISLSRRRNSDSQQLKQYYCPECGKGFPSRDAVQLHVSRLPRDHRPDEENQLRSAPAKKKAPRPPKPDEDGVIRLGRRPVAGQDKIFFLEDLVTAGIIPVGAILEAFGQSGIVTSDGAIRAGKYEFATPSSWVLHLRGEKSAAWKSAMYMGKTLQYYKDLFTMIKGTLPKRTVPEKATEEDWMIEEALDVEEEFSIDDDDIDVDGKDGDAHDSGDEIAEAVEIDFDDDENDSPAPKPNDLKRPRDESEHDDKVDEEIESSPLEDREKEEPPLKKPKTES
jgi:hypothetical protein